MDIISKIETALAEIETIQTLGPAERIRMNPDDIKRLLEGVPLFNASEEQVKNVPPGATGLFMGIPLYESQYCPRGFVIVTDVEGHAIKILKLEEE